MKIARKEELRSEKVVIAMSPFEREGVTRRAAELGFETVSAYIRHLMCKDGVALRKPQLQYTPRTRTDES